MNIPVLDLHCDTALSLVGKGNGLKHSLRSNSLHIDLERAGGLAGYCQCFACFTTPYMVEWKQGTPEDVFEKEMNAIRGEIERNSDVISQVYSVADIEENLENGKMSAILTIEGSAGFGYDPELLQDLYAAGFRITSLGWNESNPLTGSHQTGGGLTDLGREYVREAQRLGMIVDVSHISDEGFWDIIEITQAPIVATHSNSRQVCNVSRNLTDDMFRAICRTGGVAGFNQCAPFVGKEPDLNDACKHFLHFMELDADGTHIALGGDLDGCDKLPAGFEGVQDYPKLAQKLLESGLNEDNLRNIFWNNALGVMKKCFL